MYPIEENMLATEDDAECYNDDELRELAFIDQFCMEAECDAMPF